MRFLSRNSIFARRSADLTALFVFSFSGISAMAQQTITYTNGDNASPITITGTLNPTTLMTPTGTIATQSGVISESGTLGYVIKTGTGTLTLSGTNTYSGGTEVDAGTLLTSNASALGSGNITLGGGVLQIGISAFTTGAGVTLTGSTSSAINTNGFDATFNGSINNDSANNSQLVKTGSGNLTLNGSSNTISSFFVNGGNLTQTTGSLTSYEVGVGSGTGTTGTYTMSGGSIYLPAGHVPAIVGGSSTAASFRVGDFGGTGTFLQSGGTVTINGALNIGNQGGHGTYVLSGGALNLESGQDALGRTNGSSSGSTGELDISGSGQLNIDGTNQFIGSNWYPTTGSPFGSGIINQTGGAITVANTAQLYLTGNGSGTYNLDGGTLNVGGTSLIGVFNGGTYSFNLGGGTIKVYGTDLNTSVNGTLTSGTTSTVDTNGLNATFNGVLSGNGSLLKTGSGNMTLSQGNSYTGGTEVAQGNLLVKNTSGSATGTGTLTVDSAAGIGTAGASGTITSTTNAINSGKVLTGGTGISDTTSILTMTASGTTTFNNANLVFNLSTTSAGQGSQLALVATPSVLFTTTTLTLNLQGSGLIPVNTPYTLLTSTLGGSGVGGSIFGGDISYNSTTQVISGLTLTFANTSDPGYAANSYLKLVSSGSGYNLEVLVVPEPGTWALLLSGLSLLGLSQYRKRPSSMS